MPPANPPQATHSVQDAAILTSHSEWTIRTAISNDELPADTSDGRVRITPDDLSEWVRTVTSAGDDA